MVHGLPLAALLALFAAGAVAIWVAGIALSNSTDVLARRFGLGQALGGVILLAIATNLPEIAITASAAAAGTIGVAVGNILGGIAIQTVVLVALDAFGMPEKVPLTYKAASLTLVIEGLLVVAVLIVSIMGTQMPASLIALRITPIAVLILLFWLLGVWLIGRANRGLPWHDRAGDAPGTQEKPKGHSQAARADDAHKKGVGTTRTVIVFVAAAVVTLVAGVVLERAGDAIADHIGMTGVLFGATVLAAATSLPELSTGLASTKAGDYQLAVSDIFGGNAFLPVLFLLATLVSGQAVLPQAQKTDIYLAGLAVLLTSVYLAGLIFRPRRRVLGMGVDSLAVLALYLIGTAGLFAIAWAGGQGG
ncbi:sodium:calcium antiporter [Sphingomonas morindae]|uniref:Sodium:calcium antiporter n=1 Tax=Sphingomonas morindae TaxID=1541170 RepID=A0ABY4X479_9SPHN|nr:sodium:calcium antiporter [Sphingomonas morindae]USI71688.1 sodium:calcium antiporter [Sphingomonas morindae]